MVHLMTVMNKSEKSVSIIKEAIVVSVRTGLSDGMGLEIAVKVFI